MSGDYARWLANETAAALTHDTPACPVCRDTLIVQCPEPDGSGVYEQACPSPSHSTGDTDRAVRESAERSLACPECGGRGWTESDHCNCGVGPSGYYGMHERHCGLEPCPRGCPFVPPSLATPAPMAGEKESKP